jgi:glycosyltransferase involved in cell wall biosynthesis
LLHRAWLRGDWPPAEALTGRVDVVHGTNFTLPPPRRAAGVVTVHDLTFARFPELVDAATLAYRTLVPRAVARAARVLTPTRAVADELQEHFAVGAERIVVTPLGVDPRWFDAASAAPVEALPDDYLVAVGALEPRKGLDVLLDAYRMLLGEHAAAPPLVVVGPPGWGPRLRTAGIPEGKVLLPGFQPLDRLRRIVGHARLLAFPSRYEGFGLPPLEALAAGTPVVASDVPAVREVLGGHGRLVPVGDAAALAGAIAQELAGPLGDEQRAAGREHARTFTWSRCAERTAAAYREAAG